MVATSAKVALELFGGGERFDVVLCDLIMPEMSGTELFGEIRARYPDQASRFVFMSGASFNPQIRAFIATIPNTLLMKPLDMRRLTELVKDHMR